jgi:pseudouridine-5'-phosphate glycosidase
MNKLGIKGKESTPFLLKTITDLTKGDSLESNIQLVLNNAKVGANIAKEYCKLK